jgi:hypothetical protein
MNAEVMGWLDALTIVCAALVSGAIPGFTKADAAPRYAAIGERVVA